MKILTHVPVVRVTMLVALIATSFTIAPAPTRAQDASAAATAPATMLRMRDGSIRWGNIQSHDPEGLVFEVLETGGRVRLPWKLLHPDEESELRRRFGYVDLSSEEVMIEADRIVTVDGAEIVGLIIDRTGDTLLVKTANSTVPVPKNRLSGVPTTVQVRAEEVFTRAELYAQRLSNLDLSTADGNFQLAQWCERILDFAHAVEHYKKAQTIDAKYKPDDVKVSLDRAVEKAARQDQIDYLADVEAMIARRRFDEALARAEAFATKFPDSPLLPNAKKSKEHVLKARERFVADRVSTLWLLRAAHMARLAGQKMGYEEAVSYAGGSMQKDVLDYVVKEASLITKEATPDAVKKLWTTRKKGRWNRASYGLGTWLLGRDVALKGGEEKKPDTKPLSEKDKERADLEKKLERYLQNQELARKSKAADEQVDDREKAWKELTPENRAGWILAYYAENSGDFEVDPRPQLSACRECGGKGTREMAMVGGNVGRQSIGKSAIATNVECDSCHGIGYVRRISYR